MGCALNESVFIPRIPLILSDYLFEFKRLQFPLMLCFVTTMNTSQEQTYKFAGVDLKGLLFSLWSTLRWCFLGKFF